MLNRYFNTEGNINFIYANSVLKNIDFALISLEYIMNDFSYNCDIYHDEHTYYFYHIQSLLTACGNISNVFYNNTNWANKSYTKRAAKLRILFNIAKTQYPLVFQKEARNTNEHFDERYEEWGGNIGDYNIIDENIDDTMKKIIVTDPHLRTFDKSRKIYYTYNRNKEQISYDLNILREELYEMKEKILNNPILNSAWIEELPNEIIISND